VSQERLYAGCTEVEASAGRGREETSPANALLELFESHLDMVDAFEDADFIEIGPRALIVHRRRGDRAPS
jgi:hypothetical protein